MITSFIFLVCIATAPDEMPSCQSLDSLDAATVQECIDATDDTVECLNEVGIYEP